MIFFTNPVDDVLFDFDSSVLRSEYNAKLNELGDYLVKNPDAFLVVGGFADSAGDDEYNLWLSKRRALSVKSYLLGTYDIDGQRVVSEETVALFTRRGGADYRRVLESNLEELRDLGDAIDNLVDAICLGVDARPAQHHRQHPQVRAPLGVTQHPRRGAAHDVEVEREVRPGQHHEDDDDDEVIVDDTKESKKIKNGKE